MKVGITGSKGFIGSVVKNDLIKKKIKLINFDCNLASKKEIQKLIKERGLPDVLIHFAGRFSNDTSTLIKDNLISTINLLEVFAYNNKNVHIIFSSSGAVYGDSGKEPINEKHIKTPNTSYGLIKLMCEQTIQYYENLNKCKSTILRFPSVYGQNNNKGIVYEWISSINKKNEVCIRGDGNQHRSFLDVDDIPIAISKIIEAEIYGDYNLSNSKPYSLNDLAKIFVEKFKCSIVYKDKDTQNNLQSMVLSSEKMKNDLALHPKKNIESFLDKQV